jgi:hypothetical protein
MTIHRLSLAQLRSKMEPLRLWHPQIDKSRFHQGAISDEMWVKFEQLVRLCHVYRHWQQVCLKKRFPPRDQVEGESKYSRKKRHDEWKREIYQSERHMDDAALLAADKMADMSLLITNGGPRGRQDWKLYSALRLAVAPFPRHERGRFSAAAFRAFDANCELQDKLDEIASRWLGLAGYRSASLRIDASFLPAPPTPLQRGISTEREPRTREVLDDLTRTASAEPGGAASRQLSEVGRP